MAALGASLLVGGYEASSFTASASGAKNPTFSTTVRSVKATGRPVTVKRIVPVTVKRVVTVREKGPLMRKLVPVVQRVSVPGQTVYVTTTTQVPRRVLVPVTVTVEGPAVTVVRTRLVPTVRTQTAVVTRAVTHEQTVTDEQTVTRQQTVTNRLTMSPAPAQWAGRARRQSKRPCPSRPR